jgi:5-methylcytosine-specific restriction endonuclease McrA
VNKRRGYIPLGSYTVKTVDGVKLCLNCEKPVAKGRRRYCSPECFIDFFVKNRHNELRDKIARQKDYFCCSCNKKIPDRNHFILDHILPIALGGAEFDESNLQILCIECDKVKTAKDMTLIAKRRRDERILSGGQKKIDYYEGKTA